MLVANRLDSGKLADAALRKKFNRRVVSELYVLCDAIGKMPNNFIRYCQTKPSTHKTNENTFQ
jgi:hypothetical protein